MCDPDSSPGLLAQAPSPETCMPLKVEDRQGSDNQTALESWPPRDSRTRWAQVWGPSGLGGCVHLNPQPPSDGPSLFSCISNKSFELFEICPLDKCLLPPQDAIQVLCQHLSGP